jgi:hypothetical protein
LNVSQDSGDGRRSRRRGAAAEHLTAERDALRDVDNLKRDRWMMCLTVASVLVTIAAIAVTVLVTH